MTATRVPDPDLPPQVLILTGDPLLADTLAAVAANVGAPSTWLTDPTTAAAPWRAAPFVLLGADLAEPAAAQLRRRSGVVVVTADPDDAGVWGRAAQVGADFVAVLPDAAPWLPEVLRQFTSPPRATGPVVAVIGGRGGAGASSLAAALALSATRTGRRVLLVDLDDEGGGLDLVFGLESEPGVRWPGLLGLRGSVAPDAVLDTVVTVRRHGGVMHLVSADRVPGSPTPEAMAALLDSVAPAVDLTVLDIGRCRGPAVAEALARSSSCLLVVPRETRAAVAAAQTHRALATVVPSLELVVRGPAPAGLTADAVGDMVGLTPTASLRPDPGLAAALDHGDPPAPGGPLAGFADRWLAGLWADRPATAA